MVPGLRTIRFGLCAAVMMGAGLLVAPAELPTRGCPRLWASTDAASPSPRDAGESTGNASEATKNASETQQRPSPDRKRLPSNDDGARRTPNGSADFQGIELGPGILNAVQKRVLIEDWSQREIDAYYQVLDFVRRTGYSRQKQRARENVLREIETFKRKVEAAYREELETIEQNADELGAIKTARRKSFAAQKRNRLLNQYEEYREQPEDFPLFSQLFTSLYRDEHDETGEKQSRFRGKLVTLTGRLRKLISYPAHKNEYGIEQLHEAWIYTDDAREVFRDDPSPVPVVVICTQLPPGIPQGEKVSETVSVTGYVFRMHYFENEEGDIGRAPMLLASRIEWQPRPASSETPLWIKAAILGAIGLILLAIIVFGRRDKAAHKQQLNEMLYEDDLPPPGGSPPKEQDR